eukprot:16765-Pyramimonas_sp.AAC.1
MHAGGRCGDGSNCDASQVDVAVGVLPQPARATLVMVATVAGGALTTWRPYCMAGPKLVVPIFLAKAMELRNLLNLGSLFLTLRILLCTVA